MKIEFLESDSHTIRISPFFLENLLFHAFHFALSSAAPDRHIKVALLADSRGAQVEISGVAPDGFEAFPPPRIASLAEAVGAGISSEKSFGKLRIVLPQPATGRPGAAWPVKS